MIRLTKKNLSMNPLHRQKFLSVNRKLDNFFCLCNGFIDKTFFVYEPIHGQKNFGPYRKLKKNHEGNEKKMSMNRFI